jgi:hypothetical protein
MCACLLCIICGQILKKKTSFAAIMIQPKSNHYSSLCLKNALILFVGIITLYGCKDEPASKNLLDSFTRNYFDFAEDSRWEFTSSGDSDRIAQEFTLKNRVNQFRMEDNSEFILYELVEKEEYKLSFRIETGPSGYSDRIAVLEIKNNGTPSLLSLFWVQKDGFYVEKGQKDTMTYMGTVNINGVNYEEVWQYSSANKDRIRKLMVSKNKGIILMRHRNADADLMLKNAQILK